MLGLHTITEAPPDPDGGAASPVGATETRAAPRHHARPTSPPYEIIVVGGGSAGIVSANVAAALGVRTALVERDRIGGECLWTGCVPSKALIHTAKLRRQASDARRQSAGDSVGLASGARRLASEEALRYVRESIQRVKEADATEAMMRDFGVEIFLGAPRFEDRHTLRVGDHRLRARQFILATGSHPAIPEVPGLLDSDYLTNQTIFDLQEVPESLTVLGGGPIGVELAQAFRRLGAEVTVLQRGSRLLPRDDTELTDQLEGMLRDEGIRILTKAEVTEVARQPDGTKRVSFRRGGEEAHVRAAELLVATGRRPNVEGLNLEAAGVRLDENGVRVDRRLRTSASNIWACGDILGRHQFSHMAEHEAKAVVRNALLPFPQRVPFAVEPWTTFTDPELAHVGLTEAEAREQRRDVRVYRHSFQQDDRALVDEQARGLVKIVADGRGRVLGAHILGPRAGELIHEFVLAMRHGLSVRALADTIHVYPTLSMANQRAAQRYYQEFAEQPLMRNALRLVFWLTRRQLRG
jgi:pyruvate/2-oxoglutarate dehydrogenase complex dihydrolipoamide dehydrogenase (E3) component